MWASRNPYMVCQTKCTPELYLNLTLFFSGNFLFFLEKNKVELRLSNETRFLINTRKIHDHERELYLNFTLFFPEKIKVVKKKIRLN